ncbi:MAG TPA: trypsin-like serine protease [Polyangiaceae bacterium]
MGRFSSTISRTIAASALVLIACSGDGEHAATAPAPLVDDCSGTDIYGGSPAYDGTWADAVVMVSAPDHVCSGALVGPRLVVTARHCVGEQTDPDGKVYCSASHAGDSQVGPDLDPSTLVVSTGYDGLGASSFGVQILHEDGDRLCNEDIAFLVLNDELPGTPLAFSSAPPFGGEKLQVAGYGLRPGGCYGQRYVKGDVAVIATGPGTLASGKGVLGTNEIESDLSFCHGDSGGPAIGPDGAIVGLVERGGDCEANEGHVYTTTAAFGALATSAYAAANAFGK